MSATFGVTLVSGGGGIYESVDLESKVDLKVLVDSSGVFSAAQAMAPTFTFSVRGKGTAPVAIKASSGNPSGASGKVIVTSVKLTQSNEDWQGFEYSGTSYPGVA
jgi:hypothetical protein